MNLDARLLAVVQAIGADVKTLFARSASDPWTRVVLAADFNNGTVTFNTITGFSFTPPANTNWTVEAEVLLQTIAVANLPRLGVSVGAGQAYYGASLTYPSSASAKIFLEAWGTTALGTHQMPAGTAIVASQPVLATVVMKGRSGASPGVIALQLAAETAGTNAVVARQGSEFRYRYN